MDKSICRDTCGYGTRDKIQVQFNGLLHVVRNFSEGYRGKGIRLPDSKIIQPIEIEGADRGTDPEGINTGGYF